MLEKFGHGITLKLQDQNKISWGPLYFLDKLVKLRLDLMHSGKGFVKYIKKDQL